MALVDKTSIKDLVEKQSPPKEYENLGDEKIQLDLNELYSPHSKYTPEQKMYAVVAYMVTGSSIKAEKMTGIDASTIRWWKTKSEWWDKALAEARRTKQDALDAHLTGLIHRSAEEFEDRLLNGDEVVDKYGDTHRKKMSGRDIATTLGILFDKRALIRGDPTSNSGASSSQLKDLSQKFEDFAHKMRESGNMAKPIEGKYKSISADELLNKGENYNGATEQEE